MKKLFFLTTLFIFSLFFTKNVFAATEFVSVVDTGNGSGTDYTSLSTWETGVQTDLTTAQMFSGTMGGSQMADTVGTIYLCRSGVYQDHYGTLVHERADGTQILIEDIVGAAVEQSGDIWYTANTCDSANYFTLSGDQAGGDSAIAIAKCRATTGAADTTSVTIDGWTTSASNYIKIWTDPSENYRHSGKWDEGKYRLEIAASGYTYAIIILEQYTRIDGLQIKVSGTTTYDADGIYLNPSSNGDIQISNNIIRGSLSAGGVQDGIIARRSSKIWNNIIYGFEDIGITTAYYNAAVIYLYNNTVLNAALGINNYNSDNTVYAKNNIAYNNTDNYFGTFDASSTNNLSGPGADADIPATNARNGYVVHFADEYNKDFHLDSADTGARNQGIILYDAGYDANLNFTTDIDNNSRLDSAGTWDIGADEVITKVYRSVGPSASSALSVGSTYGNVEVKAAYLSGSTTNITDYVATFWSDLPTNVGVGDALQYDDDDNGTIDASDSIVFITKRIDASHFAVRSASGGIPSFTLAPDSDWSIFRAYTSLATAESIDANADENNSIDDDLENFDNWTAGRDIATNQEQWNIACYANSTTADTAAVVINGWTTSADSFIKIYTPTRSDEVGTSQRHNGIWDEGKYIIRSGSADLVYIGTNNSYLRIDGIQFDDTESSYLNHAFQGGGAPGEIHISNCIMKNTGSGAANGMSIESTGGIFKIWNNIIYGFGNGITFNNTAAGYIYNNTIVAITNYSGIRNQNGNSILYAKNNIVQGSPSSAYFGTFQVGSDYNISDDTSTTLGAHDKPSITTVAFFDSANNDFHLAPSDTEAKNAGTDLSNDPYIPYNTDITSTCLRKDKQSRVSNGGDDLCYTRPRGTSWDIGADELITKIYRSVGPGDTSDLNTGSATVTIAVSGLTGTATFSAALPDNIGVGDVLEYPSGAPTSVAIISGRTDSTHYTVQGDVGLAPTAASAGTAVHIHRAYTSLYNAEAGAKNTSITPSLTGGNRNIVANSEQWNIACYANGTTADTTAVTVDGWTTGLQNYIKIYTPTLASEVGTSQRHSGKWDDGKYRLEQTTDSRIIDNRVSYTVFDGLQIARTGGVSVNNACIYSTNPITVKNSIKKGHAYGVHIVGATGNSYIYNSIFYNHSFSSITNEASGSTVYVYNVTSMDCGYRGIYNHTGTMHVKNAISMNSVNNNIAGATSQTTNVTSGVSFVDETNDDFHLLPADTGARNYGADLSQDYNLPITTDIDGQSRPQNNTGFSADIGADESATPIYRSIAPSKTDALASGTGNNLTISGTTATFASTVEGTNAIGVGDAIQYDSDGNDSIDAIAFISARASSTSFTIQSRDGSNPVAVTNDQDWSIFRAYTTLDNAEGGVENTTNIDDDVDDFDISVSRNDGKDIYTSNEQWNIAAYANGATADTVAVSIDGWTTYPTNYIKIYTPVSALEVGTSQRHSGAWDSSKYNANGIANGAISIREDYVRIEGIQLNFTTTDFNVYAMSAWDLSSSNEVIFSQNIIKSAISTTNSGIAGIYVNDSDARIKVYNNNIYDFKTSGGFNYGIRMNSVNTAYIYNNTTFNDNRGIRQDAGTVIVKNNITQDCTDGYNGTFDASSDFNISDVDQTDADDVNVTFNGYKTVSFLDETGSNFHLSSSDTAARGAGTNLSADLNLSFSDDIDGDTRGYGGAGWDIGADEYGATAKALFQGILKFQGSVRIR